MAQSQNRSPASARALITGASTGIGLALAREFARNGHPLVLAARSEDRLRKLAEELQAQHHVPVEVFVQDLSAADAASELVQALKEAGLAIDILVNNAGFVVYGPFADSDWAEVNQMLHVNLLAVTHLTRLLVGDMRLRGYGRIMNLGSIGSFIPSPLNAVYSATKAYVLSFSQAIADELRGSGVTVTAVCPGATRSEFHQRSGMERVPLVRLGLLEPSMVAQSGYRALMSGKRVVVPGLMNRLIVSAVPFVPGSLLARLARMMLA